MYDAHSRLANLAANESAACEPPRNTLKFAKVNRNMPASIIVSNPAILSGEPVFRGTRVPFKSLTDYLEHGRTLSEFLEDFPSVTEAVAIAAIEETSYVNSRSGASSCTAGKKRNGSSEKPA